MTAVSKYGRPFEGMAAGLLAQEEVAAQDGGPQMGLEAALAASAVPRDFNPLLAAVKKWGNYVVEEARKELAAFYTATPKAQPLSPATEPALECWKSPEALRRKWWIPSRPRVVGVQGLAPLRPPNKAPSLRGGHLPRVRRDHGCQHHLPSVSRPAIFSRGDT